jgi:tetratricopeptide (TPR) repeat protein
MDTEDLQRYLRPIPLVRCLPSGHRRAIASRLVQRHLRGGERIDLDGRQAQVLCVVCSGEVTMEVHSAGQPTLRRQLTTGQWLGQGLALGWRRATRTSLVADGEGANVLLLWRQDLSTVRIVRWLTALASGLARAARLLEHPALVGTMMALGCLAGFLAFSAAGRSFLADWAYFRLSGQPQLSHEERLQRLSRILDLQPGHALATVALGNLYAECGDLESAMLTYTGAPEGSAAAANNLGVLLFGERRLEQALDALALGTELDPDAAIIYQNLGIACQQEGLELEAARAFRETLRIDPSLTDARYHLGLYYLREGDLAKAAAAFETVLEHDPACAPAFTALGLVYLDMEDLERAAGALRQAERLQSDSLVTQFYLGWTEARLGNVAQARSALVRALVLHPSQDLRERVAGMLDVEASYGH